MLNFDRPEFQQRGLRQALYYAINRPEIVEKATRNSTVAGNPGHIHPDSEWYYNDVKQYDFDPLDTGLWPVFFRFRSMHFYR